MKENIYNLVCLYIMWLWREKRGKVRRIEDGVTEEKKRYWFERDENFEEGKWVVVCWYLSQNFNWRNKQGFVVVLFKNFVFMHTKHNTLRKRCHTQGCCIFVLLFSFFQNISIFLNRSIILYFPFFLTLLF
jgi:hypothetical protein